MPSADYIFFKYCWFAGALLKAYASSRLRTNGQISRVPALWALITVLCLENAAGILFHQHPEIGVAIYPYFSVAIWLCEGLAVIAAFRGLAESIPRFEQPVTALLAALAIVGTCACWMAGFFRAPSGWKQEWEIVLAIQRNVGLVMVAMLAGSRLAIAVMGFPTRKSARRLSDILTLYVTGAFAASAFGVHSHVAHPIRTALLPVWNGALLAWLCAFHLVRASDRAEDMMPIVWAAVVDQPKAQLLQMEGSEELRDLLSLDVKPRNDERSRGASGSVG